LLVKRRTGRRIGGPSSLHEKGSMERPNRKWRKRSPIKETKTGPIKGKIPIR